MEPSPGPDRGEVESAFVIDCVGAQSAQNRSRTVGNPPDEEAAANATFPWEGRGSPMGLWEEEDEGKV